MFRFKQLSDEAVLSTIDYARSPVPCRAGPYEAVRLDGLARSAATAFDLWRVACQGVLATPPWLLVEYMPSR